MARSGDGSRPARTNVRGAATRARLVEAALVSFAAKGFHATSTRDIAEAAGLSPAAVYVHFGTKEELLFELSFSGHVEVHRVVEEAAARPGTAPERLRGIAEDFTVWHAESHVRARVIQYELAALTPEHAAEVARWRRDMERLVREAIDEGIAAGDFAVADPRMATVAILSLSIDVARWYRDGGAWSPREIGRQYGELALGMAGHGGSAG